MNRIEKKRNLKSPPFGFPAGTVLTCATGKFTVLDFRDGKERLYICSYKSEVNPAYDRDGLEISEKDAENLYRYWH
ncbi:MAG: hypothetical protein LBK22_00205 [Tannerella sp.]|jgi:hypothetical protein|nr:hypothetical protein [Tannerella sp.]